MASKKECPSCAMLVDKSAKVCPICQYEFATLSLTYKIVAVLLVLLFLLFYIL